jgi:SAM-dependent methyltransferase
LTDPKYGTSGRWSVVRCAGCGLAFLSPRPTSATIGDYYPPGVAEHQDSASEPNSFSEAEASIVQAACPTPARLLDVGCAAGMFLATMLRVGWTVAGVEPSADAAEKARARTGAQVHQGRIEEAEFPPESFRVITFWSVFEHVHDPVGALTAARRLISPDGHLFLGLPNFGSIERLVFREHWFALDLPRHLYHFEPRTIASCLARSGFRVASIRQASGHDTIRGSFAVWRGRKGSPVSQRAVFSAVGQGKAPAAATLKGRVVAAAVAAADRMGRGSQMLVHAVPDGGR